MRERKVTPKMRGLWKSEEFRRSAAYQGAKNRRLEKGRRKMGNPNPASRTEKSKRSKGGQLNLL